METTTCLAIRFASIHSRTLLKSYITKPSSAFLQSSSGNNPEQHVKPRLWTSTGNVMTWGLSNTTELAPNSLNWHDLRVVCCQWKIVTINSNTQLALYPRLFWDPFHTMKRLFLQYLSLLKSKRWIIKTLTCFSYCIVERLRPFGGGGRGCSDWT